MAARDSRVGGHTMVGFAAGERAGGGAPSEALRGAWMARITSAARSHFEHATHSVPPARLRATRATAFGPAHTGHTNGMSTGAFAGSAFVTP